MRIGLTYNLKKDKAKGGPEGIPDPWNDSDAEYEDQETIDALAEALQACTQEPVVRLPCDPDLSDRLHSVPFDLIFNIAEGWGGRNREAFAPSLFEIFGIPYTGSDGLCLSLTLNKVLTKKILMAEGILTPEFFVIREASELRHIPLPFPLFVKPCHEGTSKGIRNFSMVRNRDELARAVSWVLTRYDQPALVERFISGPEVAVGIMGNGPDLRILPHAEIRFTEQNPFYSFECKSMVDEEILCPAPLGPPLSMRIGEIARAAYESLGCRDLARIDLRIDETGEPYVLEINPLPGLSSRYSLFPVQASAAGMDYKKMVRTLVEQAMKRYGMDMNRSSIRRASGSGLAKPREDEIWKEEVRNRVREPEELRRFLNLDDAYLSWLKEYRERLPFAVVPYLLSIADRDDPGCPIRRQFLPSPEELNDRLGYDDPLMEKEHEAAPGLIRVYEDRAAWCVSSFCPSLCRYCLRRDRFQSWRQNPPGPDRIASVLNAVSLNPGIRDLLLTGGDPLVFEDDFLEDLLSKIRELDQIQILRIGTRLPCTLPSRITKNLLRMLRKFQPIWISTQFNHPREITPDSAGACIRIAEAGIPVLNQSVLLHGINDTAPVMKELVERLVRIRVRPYYLYQCQLVSGTAHFRTAVEQGMDLVRALRGRTSGFAIPLYVLDTPYGKVPLAPNYFKGREDGSVMMESFDGRIWKERNPVQNAGYGDSKKREGLNHA
ncbi:MAG: KamA family radical SAM protein [bacterium]